jgi:hypothetical protein
VPKHGVPRMAQAQSFYEGHSFNEVHTPIRERIGQDLQEHYEVPKQLPRKLLTLVRKLDEWPGPLWSELYNRHNRPPPKSWLDELAAEWDAMLNAGCQDHLEENRAQD